MNGYQVPRQTGTPTRGRTGAHDAPSGSWPAQAPIDRAHPGICDHRLVEDVVAVELITPTGGPHFVVTFGRIQNRVDPAELEAIVLSHASTFGLGHATAARVCGSLQEARGAPYFFEALIDFGAAMAGVRANDDPDEWRDGIDAEMRSGRGLYYLGDPQAEWFRRD